MATAEANKIPNLWGFEELNINILTPRQILEAQATYFSQITKGLLVAEVVNIEKSPEKLSFGLDIVAPTLNNYRKRILSVNHNRDEPYPVDVFDSLYIERVENIKKMQEQMKAYVSLPPRREILQYSQEDFTAEIREMLSSGPVIGFIQSLLARINESENQAQETK